MFQNLMMLKDKPLHVDWPLVADYSPDRIIFYLRLDDDGEKLKEIALVSLSVVRVFSIGQTEKTVSCSSSVSRVQENWQFYAYVGDY